MVEIELGPEAVEEEYLSVLVALPEHKITQPLNTAGPDEKVQGRVL